jgi:hypothetical protein
MTHSLKHLLRARFPHAHFRLVEAANPEAGLRSLVLLWTGQASYSGVVRALLDTGAFERHDGEPGRGMILQDAGRLVVTPCGELARGKATPWDLVQVLYHRRLFSTLPPCRRGWRIRRDEAVRTA